MEAGESDKPANVCAQSTSKGTVTPSKKICGGSYFMVIDSNYGRTDN